MASNYRRGKNFDPVEMRRRWNTLDVEFGSQAAKAAERERHRTEEIKSEKQTISPHQQIPDSSNTRMRANTKTAVAAVDFAIAQAKEQKAIEVSKGKWITRQSLLTEALNYSPAELTIDEVKAEFGEREKNGELWEFEIDRRKTKNRVEQENPALESGIAVKGSFSEQLPLNRKDFADEEKSVTEAPPNPEIPLQEIETNQKKTSETKLEIRQDSKESFEEIYDKTGILQSRTRTNGKPSEESSGRFA